MNNIIHMETIKEKIENKREKLNNLLVTEKNKDVILDLSIELDKFINLYYKSLESSSK